MPEKNGCTVTVGVLTVETPLVVLVVETLVTKNSSVPTLSTAFWLLIVASRGLESTCTSPWDSRNVNRAAKLLVCSARPNTAPAGFSRATVAAPAAIERPAVSAMMLSPEIAAPRAASAAAAVPVVSWPAIALPEPELWKIAQLMPARWVSDSVTSTIFASSMTWRSMEMRVAAR